MTQDEAKLLVAKRAVEFVRRWHGGWVGDRVDGDAVYSRAGQAGGGRG